MENDVLKTEKKLETNYHRTKMQKEMVLQRLKENGCRITKQRKILLDIILQEECASCKEIYYKAISEDSSIGTATVYRMVNLLEEIGAISRKNMYRISCDTNCSRENICVIRLDDHTICRLSSGEWYKVISEGLRCCGYVDTQKVASVVVEPCEKEDKSDTAGKG
ncbi:MAG: transcriptional repressor [Lachnospiraceae bacterium]